MKLLLDNRQIILDASQSLNALAKAVRQAGDAETADVLLRRAAELELASPELQDCWGGPFNGQSGREAIMRDLLRILRPAVIVETGTFRGVTAEWFATHIHGLVLTCEKERLYQLQAEARLAPFPNARLYLMDTRCFLRECLPSLPTEEAVLFYLDAHWELDLPLKEELQIIFSSRLDAVVVIDDFRVPDDAGYGWDDYGLDKSLELQILEGVIPQDVTIFFPSLHSDRETGAVRGCCVIAAEASTKMGKSSLLRGNSFEHWMKIASSPGATVSPSLTPSDGREYSGALKPKPPAPSKSDTVREAHLAELSALMREVDQLRSQTSFLQQNRKELLNNNNTLVADVGLLRSQLSELDRARRQSVDTLTAEAERLQSELAEARKSFVDRAYRTVRQLIEAATRSWNKKAVERPYDDSEYLYWIKFVYAYCLGREPDPDGLAGYMYHIKNGMSFSRFVKEVENSPEARQRGRGASGELSDGEFILNVAEMLFQGGSATPRDIEYWKGVLKEDRGKRSALIQNLIDEHVIRERDGEEPWNPHKCWIMGTDRFLTHSDWQKRAEELEFANASKLSMPARSGRGFTHSGKYAVSAIASLYKGRRYIEAFLENITAQTIFDRSELIIIDADSPEGEDEIIVDYQKVYPNIIYKRMNYRIGIYDAWNVGIRMARGKFLTNTNLDDLRRRDSFELQANALDQHASVDVTYQDFFYSFDASLSFDEVAKFGFKSELPIVTPHNLLAFNSPHNAPMWRKISHEQIGLFDTSFKSAGDWEFWLRCISMGRRFLKLNTPHVVYFQNPEGVSTRLNSRGIEEGRQLLNRYSRKLISKNLLMSRQVFADLLGHGPDWEPDVPYYDVVQTRLKLLGDRYKETHAADLAKQLQGSTQGEESVL